MRYSPEEMREWTPVAAVIGWFLFLTHRALGYGFNPDDVMLMNFAIGRPLKLHLQSIPFFWNGSMRPLGSIFYLTLYKSFGYWAVPYRIAAFVLLTANLILLYRCARAITKGRKAAFLVLLAGCFHGAMWDIYANTGTVYDLLCQFFILLTVTVWANGKVRPVWLDALLVGLLTVGAVESKEMGVAIPVILLCYDLLFRRGAIRYVAIVTASLVTAVFLVGRFAQQTAVTGNVAFTPIITFPHYLMTTRLYLGFLLNRPGLSEIGTAAVLLAALGLACALRNRVMLFGLAYYLFTLMPMSFATARTGYALYVPAVGAVFYAVALFSQITDYLMHRTGFAWARPALTGVFAFFVMASQFSANRRLEAAKIDPGYLPQLEALTTGMRRAYPTLPPGALVTLVNDPFLPDAQFTALFTLRAFYDDPALLLQRIHWDPARGPEQLNGAQYPLFFVGLRSWRFGSRDDTGNVVDGRPREGVAMSSAMAALSIVADVAGEPAPDGTRWAYGNPEFVFSRPPGLSEFAMEYDFPGAVFEQTGPLRLRFEITGQPPQRIVLAAPGPQQYAVKLQPGAAALVHVKIHVENPYVGADRARLSVLVKWAGMRKEAKDAAKGLK